MRGFIVSAFAVSALGLGSAAMAAPDRSSTQADQQSAAAGGQGKARGTPQRDPTTPPGLVSVFNRNIAGIILRARLATIGSNSRLQDRPVSP